MDATRSAVQALVTSRLDYCNSLLMNLPATQISRLQKIQNKAARMVTRTPKYEHLTPVLKQLHWLPVDHRITFKILVLAFKCIHQKAPSYLIELCSCRYKDTRLRHADIIQLHQPISRKVCGQNAFGVTAPHMWNKLPPELRTVESLAAFKRALKTHFFKKCF